MAPPTVLRLDDDDNSSANCCFTGIDDFVEFFDLFYPFSRCHSSLKTRASGGRHCIRHVKSHHRTSALKLVMELFQLRIPSLDAFRVMRQLSECVVCPSHLDDAPGIYQSWYRNLWIAYLEANGLLNGSTAEAPDVQESSDWPAKLAAWRKIERDTTTEETTEEENTKYENADEEHSDMESLAEESDISDTEAVFDVSIDSENTDHTHHTEYYDTQQMPITGYYDAEQTPATEPDDVESPVTGDNYFPSSSTSGYPILPSNREPALPTPPASDPVPSKEGEVLESELGLTSTRLEPLVYRHEAARADSSASKNDTRESQSIPASTVGADEPQASTACEAQISPTASKEPPSDRTVLSQSPLSTDSESHVLQTPSEASPAVPDSGQLTQHSGDSAGANLDEGYGVSKALEKYKVNNEETSGLECETAPSNGADVSSDTPNEALGHVSKSPSGIIEEKLVDEKSSRNDGESDSKSKEVTQQFNSDINSDRVQPEPSGIVDGPRTKSGDEASESLAAKVSQETVAQDPKSSKDNADSLSLAPHSTEFSELQSSPSSSEAARDRDSSPSVQSLDYALENLTISTQLDNDLPPGFRLYGYKKPSKQVKDLLRTILKRNKAESNHPGWIYGFRRVGLANHIKIGYAKDREVNSPDNSPVDNRGRVSAKDPVENRLKAWCKCCGHDVEEVFRYSMKCAAHKMELLIHETLREERRKEKCPHWYFLSRPAEKPEEHNEWFQVEEARAREVVEKWQRFSNAIPYTRKGKLSAYWRRRIEADLNNTFEGVDNWLKMMVDSMSTKKPDASN